eukprot:m.1871 g.1871  ORF g.1871 m.1871 type:complete len:368 (+) comp7988_c0_seq1:133-1236(+)
MNNHLLNEDEPEVLLSGFSWPEEQDLDGVLFVDGRVLKLLAEAGILTDDDVSEIELFTPSVDSTGRNSLVLKKLRKKGNWAFPPFYGALIECEQKRGVRKVLRKTAKGKLSRNQASSTLHSMHQALQRVRGGRNAVSPVTSNADLSLESNEAEESGIERTDSQFSSVLLGSVESLPDQINDSSRSTESGGASSLPEIVLSSSPTEAKSLCRKRGLLRPTSRSLSSPAGVWKIADWTAKRRGTNTVQQYEFTEDEMGYVLKARLYPIGVDQGKQLQIFFSMSSPEEMAGNCKPVEISLLNRSQRKQFPNLTTVFDPNDKTLRPRTAAQGRTMSRSAWKNCPSMTVQLSLINQVYAADNCLQFSFTVLN